MRTVASSETSFFVSKGSNKAGRMQAIVPSSSVLLREMNSCKVAALKTRRTRCERSSFNAEGSRETMNRVTSLFRSISVTRETRGTF